MWWCTGELKWKQKRHPRCCCSLDETRDLFQSFVLFCFQGKIYNSCQSTWPWKIIFPFSSRFNCRCRWIIILTERNVVFYLPNPDSRFPKFNDISLDSNGSHFIHFLLNRPLLFYFYNLRVGNIFVYSLITHAGKFNFKVTK